MNENKDCCSQFLMPGAILLAGALIAGAMVFSGMGNGQKQIGQVLPDSAGNDAAAPTVAPVTSADHIYGNAKAKVKVVEFSDLECPYCRRFGETMKQVVADYNGEVAWVYRHFPLESLHPYAKKAAEASECAAELGGNEKFWQYADKFIELTTNSGATDTTFAEAAVSIGLNKAAFEKCLASGKYLEKISQQTADGTKAGCQGVPYSIVIVNGKPVSVIVNGKSVSAIEGALPIDQIKQTIDNILKG
jgi:protein-disulfide isomerase